MKKASTEVLIYLKTCEMYPPKAVVYIYHGKLQSSLFIIELNLETRVVLNLSTESLLPTVVGESIKGHQLLNDIRSSV